MKRKKLTKKQIYQKAKKIKILLTDVDGVLTDTGVYYSAEGELMKRFSIRDGMGVERLRKVADVETGIVTREISDIVKRRAEKLKIEELHLGVYDKSETLREIAQRKNIKISEIAFIGDDCNDIEIMEQAGLTACPADATKFARNLADVVVKSKGGFGAFRDFAELIIESKAAFNKKERNSNDGKQ